MCEDKCRGLSTGCLKCRASRWRKDLSQFEFKNTERPYYESAEAFTERHALSRMIHFMARIWHLSCSKAISKKQAKVHFTNVFISYRRSFIDLSKYYAIGLQECLSESYAESKAEFDRKESKEYPRLSEIEDAATRAIEEYKHYCLAGIIADTCQKLGRRPYAIIDVLNFYDLIFDDVKSERWETYRPNDTRL